MWNFEVERSWSFISPFERLSPERHNLIMIPLWDYSAINSENVASITKTLYLVSSPTSNNQSLTQALNCQYPSDLKLRNYSYQTVLIKTARHTQNKANIMPKSHYVETDQWVLRTGTKQATNLLIPFILPQNVFSCLSFNTSDTNVTGQMCIINIDKSNWL